MNTALLIPLLAIPILPNLWCIWHSYNHEFERPAEKALWMAAGIFLPVLGGLGYLVFGQRRARKA